MNKYQNGRVDIITPDTSTLFGMYDKNPVKECVTFRNATEGQWENSLLSNLYFSGGNMQIIVLIAKINYKPKLLLTVNNQKYSEIAGPAFHYIDDKTQKLFFSSQRGLDGKSKGITYEITGNFNELIKSFENNMDHT